MERNKQREQPDRRFLVVWTGIFLLAGAGSALAQAQADAVALAQADGYQLEEVVVTAERRETTVQKTPVSVGVIGSGDLEKIGFERLFDIEKAVAGVTFFQGTANQQSNVIIRGVGNTNGAFTQAVGVYVDDVPLIRGFGTGQWDLPDIERIEVLRGPQGTLYGQNSSAGAVRLISRNPDDRSVAWFAAGIGNYSALDARGYVAGPLIAEVLSGSFAFSHNRHDGFGYNPTTDQRVYGKDLTLARGKLRFTPDPTLDVVLALDGALDTSDNGTMGTPRNIPDTRPRDKYVDKDLSRSRLERGGAALTARKEWSESLSLRSITAYRAYEHDPDAMDRGGLPRVSHQWDQVIRQRVFSQEFQVLGTVGRLTHTTGLLYIDENWFNDNQTWYGTAANVITRRGALTEYATRDYALYTQLDYALTERLRISGGARYYVTEQEYAANGTNLDANNQVTAVNFEVAGLEKRNEGVTPKLSLSYEWTPSVLTYVSYTQGAKFGGFNRNPQNLQVASIPANPEKVSAYELGLKSTTLGGRLRTNVSVFYNDYRDYISLINQPTINGVLINGSVLSNAAQAHTYGAEVEIRARLALGLDWNVSYAWLKSKFDEYDNPSGAAASDFTGNELPYAPRHIVSTGLNYNRTLGDAGSVSAYTSFQYYAPQYTDQSNLEASRIPSRTNTDLGASYYFPGEQWSTSLRVANVFDQDEIVGIAYTPAYGIDSANYNYPRTVLATVRYDF